MSLVVSQLVSRSICIWRPNPVETSQWCDYVKVVEDTSVQYIIYGDIGRSLPQR